MSVKYSGINLFFQTDSVTYSMKRDFFKNGNVQSALG